MSRTIVERTERRTGRPLFLGLNVLLALTVALLAYRAFQRSAYLDSLFASKGRVHFSGDHISASQYDVETKGLGLWRRCFAPVKSAYVPAVKNAKLLDGLHWLSGVTDLDLSVGDGQDAGDLASLSSLTTLRIWAKQNPDAAMDFASKLPDLDWLIIDGEEPLTDAGVRSLASLNKLTSLEIYKSTITDAGLEAIEGLPLVHLYLDGSRVTDKGLERLEGMPLYRLRVRDTRVTNRGLQALKAKIKDLETLPEGLPDVAAEAEAVDKLTSFGFELQAGADGSIAVAELTFRRADALAENGEFLPTAFDEVFTWLERLPHLKKLTIYEMKATPAGMQRLSSLQELEELVLTNAGVSDDDAPQIAKLRRLKVLHLNGSPLTDAGVESLAPLEQLVTLYLLGAKVRGAGLEKLDRLSQLKTLSLEGCPLEDKYMGSLSKFPSLSWVSLDATPLTDASIPHLGKLRGFENVLIDGTQISEEGARKLKALRSR